MQTQNLHFKFLNLSLQIQLDNHQVVNHREKVLKKCNLHPLYKLNLEDTCLVKRKQKEKKWKINEIQFT
jgi:hypothetical protein